jgi:hypothetical protein
MSHANERLQLILADQNAKYWNLFDAAHLKIDTSERGFALASWVLPRDFGFVWDEIGLNFQAFALSSRGDVAWHGRLESIEQALDNWGQPFLSCQGAGYWSSTYDLTFAGTLGTSASPETMIGSLFSGGYLPQLSNTTSGLTATGLSGQAYQTPNGGTDDVAVGNVILDLCAKGTSTTGQRVIPLVLANRKLVTRALPVTPTAKYVVKQANVARIGLRRTLTSVFNQVIVRYKSSTDGMLQRAQVNDTASQSNLGVDYTGGGTITGLFRRTVRDITGLSATNSTIATQMANAVLYTTKRVGNDSQAITIERDWVIFDTEEGGEIPNWKVQAGYWLQIPDLLPRPSESGSGTNAGDQTLQTMFYITQTQYDDDTGHLTITPEQRGQGAQEV